MIVEGGPFAQGLLPAGLEGGLEVLAHPVGGVGVEAAHAGHLVAEPMLGEDLRDAVFGTGRERFTNRVEYLKSRSGEMGALVLLGASLPLPQMHQWVMWRYRS